MRVIVNMIVKNESAIIERCLTRVLPIIDAYVIHDTGSTDDTIARITTFMEKHAIPGRVESCPFRNFGHNRSQGLLAAQKWATEQKWDLSTTYAFLVDADMLLCVGTWKKDTLAAFDAWHVEQHTNDIFYHNFRFLRLSLPWKCEKPTHEYYACDQPFNESKYLKGQIYIDDKGDGGCKADKFERDIRLLTEELEKHPDDARCTYYIAQSYRDYGKNEEALTHFEKRASQKGTFEEERWYARFQSGHCLMRLNRHQEAMHAFMRAFNERPTRVEPLYYIIRYYLDEHLHAAADILIKYALTIPLPSDVLFVEYRLYSSLVKFQAYLNSFYIHKKGDGLQYARELLTSAEAHQVHGCVIHNLRWYVSFLQDRPEIKWKSLSPASLRKKHIPKKGKVLPVKESTFPSEIPPAKESAPPVEEKYYPCNPSIVQAALRGSPPGTEYLAICRTVNYTIAPNGSYNLVADGVVRTRNFLLALDKDFEILAENELVYVQGPFPYHITGLEDMRIFVWKGELHAFATSLEQKEDHLPRICHMHIPYPAHGRIPMQPTLLEGYEDNRCQKNWTPLPRGDQLCVLYDYTPTLLVVREGKCKKIFSQGGSIHTQYLRGSSGPVPFKLGSKGMLCIAHFHGDSDGSGRLYYHTFVFFNLDLTKVLAVSHPFCLRKGGIEFVSGMTLSKKGEIILSCGIRDHEAWLICMPPASVRTLFACEAT